MNLKILLRMMALTSSLFIVSCANYEHQQSSTDVLSDVVTTSRVKSALFSEKKINSLDISVKTFKGTVQLAGIVDSQWQVDQAEKVTAAVYLVKHVTNNLTLNSD